MERIKIDVNVRERIGKEGAKKYRRAGEIPAIIYGKGINLAVKIPHASLKELKTIHFSTSTIIDMEVAGEKSKDDFSVLIRSVQFHPLTEEVIHVDFMKVNLTEKIRVRVPVVLIGEAKGVKEGGIVAQVLREIEIEGLPLDIPKKIELDISELAIGFSSHVSSIKLPANLRIITSPGETIVSIVTKTEEVAVATPEEGAPTGPEVIKEKKEGAEGEKGEGEGAPAAKEEPKEKAKEEPRDKGKDKGKEKGKEKGKDEGKGKK